jgi:DNA-binding transcriptional regulator YhcF (GntR family)
MHWAFKEGLPIYTQLIEHIKSFIVNGEFQPGQQIPPVRELAIDAGVNPNTMQRALAEMEREGLLFSERTKGRFVTEDEAVLSALRQSLSAAYIKELFNNLNKLGLTDEEIILAVQQWKKGE